MDTSYLSSIPDGSPFAFGKLAVSGTFVNRTEEKKRLSTNFTNRVNTILISPRRWGKSSLVKEVGHSMHKKNKQYRFAHLDLFSVRSENEFLEAYAKAIIKCSSGKFEEWLNNAKHFLKAITPKISIDADLNQEFSLSFDVKDIRKNAETILNLADTIAKSKGLHIVVCIDEFQNITNFPEYISFQKKLRSYWQHHQFATYCLYGSKRSMLMHLFEKSAGPFYRFGEVMYLNKIESRHWKPFIESAFIKTGKQIKESHIQTIVEIVQCHPYYLQQLCYLIWTRCGKSVKDQDLVYAIRDLVNQNSNLFEREVDGMSTSKINILKALADGFNSKLSSAYIIQAYNLGSSANVTKTLKLLDLDEIIHKQDDHYFFMDPTFQLWFAERFLGKSIYSSLLK